MDSKHVDDSTGSDHVLADSLIAVAACLDLANPIDSEKIGFGDGVVEGAVEPDLALPMMAFGIHHRPSMAGSGLDRSSSSDEKCNVPSGPIGVSACRRRSLGGRE